MSYSAPRVVICFQISIFEPLKTIEYSFLVDFQLFKSGFRKRKESCFQQKSRLNKRDFLF